MARKNPSDVAQKWSRRLGQASQDYIDGVRAVTQAPGAAAAQNKGFYASQVAQSVDKWARNTGAVTLPEWQEAAVTLGANRLSQGASAAAPKMERVFSSLLPAIEAAANKVKAMPKNTLADRVARSAAFQMEMAKYGGRR